MCNSGGMKLNRDTATDTASFGISHRSGRRSGRSAKPSSTCGSDTKTAGATIAATCRGAGTEQPDAMVMRWGKNIVRERLDVVRIVRLKGDKIDLRLVAALLS